MSSNARHREDARLAARRPLAQELSLKLTTKSKHNRLTSNLAWVAAASACLTAFALKLAYLCLELYGQSSMSPAAGKALDWSALGLCIVALAILSLRDTSKQTTEGNTQQTRINHASNLALPAPDDARLRLAQSLSHELRTPLNAVIGFSDLMSHQLHGNLGHPKYNEYCEHITTSGQNLLRAVDDILALNSHDGPSAQNVVPMPVTQALEEEWSKKNDTAKQLQIDLKIIGDMQRRVLADPEILSHALGNVLDTLTRHAPQGATLSARVSGDTMRTRIHCTTTVSASKLVETAPLVATTDPSKPHTQDTLSEAAAQALIESMDGRLTVLAPTPDGQLAVICELPSAVERADQPAPSGRKIMAA